MLLAASRNTAVRSVSTVAAAATNPSAVTASGTLGIPAQYVGTSQDGIAGVADNQQKMHDAKSAPTQPGLGLRRAEPGRGRVLRQALTDTGRPRRSGDHRYRHRAVRRHHR